MSDNDNGKKGAAPPVTPTPDLSPGNIATQVQVVLTKDGQTAIITPLNKDQTPNLPLALGLLSAGVNIIASILKEQEIQEPSRIVLVPGVPPGVNLRGKAGV